MKIKKGQFWKVNDGKTIYKIMQKQGSKWYGINAHGNHHNFSEMTLHKCYELLDSDDERIKGF